MDFTGYVITMFFLFFLSTPPFCFVGLFVLPLICNCDCCRFALQEFNAYYLFSIDRHIHTGVKIDKSEKTFNPHGVGGHSQPHPFPFLTNRPTLSQPLPTWRRSLAHM